MNTQPIFSIIVPVYNVEKYLAKCLDSLLNQTYKGLEIIVVDDVSTDSSREIAREYVQRYSDKVKLIEHKVNTRQGGARNTGLNAVSGDYIMFLDSDDYLKPDTLEKVLVAFSEKNVDVVEFAYEYVDEAGSFLRYSSYRKRIEALGGAIKPLLISEMGPCSKAYRAELFQDSKIRFPEKRYYEDYWTVPKVLLQTQKVCYLDDPLYCYRQREGSTTHDINVVRNEDIMLGTDELLRYFHEANVPNDRFAELEYLAIEHVLYHATLRVNTIDCRNDLQKKLKAFVLDRFPNYRQNPYLHLFNNRERRLIKYIEKEQYGLVYLLWHCRNRFFGAMKNMLKKIAGERFLRRLG